MHASGVQLWAQRHEPAPTQDGRGLGAAVTWRSPFSAFFSTSCAAEAMRSAADTQVPPNLCTCSSSMPPDDNFLVPESPFSKCPELSAIITAL